MKNRETEYLNKLFTGTSDEAEQSEIDFPLLEVPASLSDKLSVIADTSTTTIATSKASVFKSWPKMTSIAASGLVALVLFQSYQQQQTLKQLEQAQADLSTALHYLGEANKITRAQVLNSLNQNFTKATISPAIEQGKEAVLPALKSLESKNKMLNRTL